MNSESDLINIKVIDQLIKDIGLDTTQTLLLSLKDEFALRVENMEAAYKEKSCLKLSREAHAFKGSALTCGATLLVQHLLRVEILAKEGNAEAFLHVDEVINAADATNEALQALQDAK